MGRVCANPPPKGEVENARLGESLRGRVCGTADHAESALRPTAQPLHGALHYAAFSSAIGSFNSRAALRQNTASRSRGGRSRSSISLMARGLREVSGGASLP